MLKKKKKKEMFDFDGILLRFDMKGGVNVPHVGTKRMFPLSFCYPSSVAKGSSTNLIPYP